MSLFRAFLFSVKRFYRFQGVQPAPGSGAACPFLGHSCFQNKCFAVFRGCNRRQWDRGMSQNEQTIYFENKNVHFRDMQQRISAKNGPKLHKYLRACPFLGLSYFEFKCFTQIRTCNIIRVFITFTHA